MSVIGGMITSTRYSDMLSSPPWFNVSITFMYSKNPFLDALKHGHGNEH